MAYLLVFGIIVALTLATTSLHRYGNVQRQHPLVTLSVLTAWSFSFLIVFTIPLDVTSVSAYTLIISQYYILQYFVKIIKSIPSRLSIVNVSQTTIKLPSPKISRPAWNVNSHGVWYRNQCFQICGVLFTGHHSFSRG